MATPRHSPGCTSTSKMKLRVLQPAQDEDDPLWIDVTALMQKGVGDVHRARSWDPRISSRRSGSTSIVSNAVAVDPGHRPAHRAGDRRGQDGRRRGRHLQQGQQRRHQALQGRPRAGEDLCRVAGCPERDEETARKVGEGGLQLQARVAAALGHHYRDW